MQHQPARAFRDPPAQREDAEAEHRADPEGGPPAPIGRQQAGLQQHDRTQRPQRRPEPEAAVDRQIGAAAKARRDQLLDRGIDRGILAADAGAGQHPKYREAPEVPGQRGGRGRGEVQPQGRHEQLAPAEPVGQVSEQERARDRAGEIGAGDQPDLRRSEMQHRACFERADDRAGDRHFEPVEDPADAERDDNQAVEPRPRQPVEPGRNVGLDDNAPIVRSRIMHNRTTLGTAGRRRRLWGMCGCCGLA